MCIAKLVNVFLNKFPILDLSIGENKYGKTGHSKIFTFLRHFLIMLKHNSFRASKGLESLHNITDTDNT